MSQYGKFEHFCRDTGNRYSTIPVCNLFLGAHNRDNTGFGDNACDLRGINLSGDRQLANLGSILFSVVAILLSVGLIFYTDKRKKAAVGRREMQLFLGGYIIVSICSILSIGGFPDSSSVIRGFSAAHIGAVVATTWILMLNALIGFQMMADGTYLSIALVVCSSIALFIGSGYIALDTGFDFTGYFQSSVFLPNLSYGLYTFYLLLPLIFIVVFFIAELVLVIVWLDETKPLLHLIGAALMFALGQIFQFVISVHICNGTNGKINGGMFETLFTLFAVILVWYFWTSITEDDWETPSEGQRSEAV